MQNLFLNESVKRVCRLICKPGDLFRDATAKVINNYLIWLANHVAAVQSINSCRNMLKASYQTSEWRGKIISAYTAGYGKIKRVKK